MCKIDFGLLWRDCGLRKSGNSRVHWDDVKVVDEHKDKKYAIRELVKLLFLHQQDHRFIFGLLAYWFILRVFFFTFVSVILSKFFDVLVDQIIFQIFIHSLICLSPEKQGHDINFT